MTDRLRNCLMILNPQYAVLILGSYLLGSIPTGLVVARSRGVDIRRQGSGNFGATNVGRVLGRRWGVLVFLLDLAKGAAATICAGLVSGPWAEAPVAPLWRDILWLTSGMACVLGNVFPVFAGFKGGKGVATSLGVMLGIYPYLTLPALSAFVLWALVVTFTRYVSLGSIVAAVFVPICFLVMAKLARWPLAEHYPLLALLVIVAALVVTRHRANIARLLAGTENRIGQGAKPPAA